jgi:hypothetical protein
MTETQRIVSVDYYGGHSEITYRWRGGVVRCLGPAGRTHERIAAILAHGDN